MTSNCKDCIYYGKNLDCCDYFEIMNQLRPSPPGDECTVKVRRDRTPDANPPKRGGSRKIWDVERAYRLWMEGLPTGHIAEMVGIAGSTLSGYATKHGWPRENRPKQGQWKKLEKNAETKETHFTLAEAAGNPEEPRPEPCHLGSDTGSAGQPGHPAPDHRREESNQEMTDPKLLESAVSGLAGVDAYYTGVAISCLCNWKTVGDLKQAAKMIECMLERLEK